MYRKFEKELKKWKENSQIPLMLIGARQTGKTYLLDKFCREEFSNYFYINLEKEENIRSIFEDTIEPDRIIELIEITKKRSIDIETTIIFIDEIQVSERAISSLKYFCESEKNYKIVTAGSLLGVKINRFKSSFPVGKVDIKYLYPMDFEEYLIAQGEEKLIKEIRNHYQKMEKINESIHEKAIDLYKRYLVLGGMPSLIKDYIDQNLKITQVDYTKQENIITSYLAWISIHTENSESIKNNAIYNTIPKELARENKTFKFSLIDKDARKIRYQSSLEWLIASNMVLKCNLTTNNEIPLKAFIDNEKFKLYLSDVGLLRSLANLEYDDILLDKSEMYKGVLAENYVAMEFVSSKKELYYYRFDKYEIDFLTKIDGEIIPIEVKAGINTSSKSLNAYIEKYHPKYSIHLSMKNFGYENNIKSIPLYAVFCIE